MDTNAFYKIGYGLYVLTANENGRDNGCIINTVMQLTSDLIGIAVNKNNYTCGMVQRTKKFNVSILSETAEFETFKHFGYQSGKTIDKFAEYFDTKRSPNGLLYLTKNTCAFISAYVKQETDLGSHILFIAQPVEAQILSQNPSVTYDFYRENIKPKPQTQKHGWRCKICGYLYEGETLPADFICPICKHGTADFEKV